MDTRHYRPMAIGLLLAIVLLHGAAEGQQVPGGSGGRTFVDPGAILAKAELVTKEDPQALVEACAEAMGGVDALSAVKTTIMSYDVTITTETGQLTLGSTAYIEYPSKMAMVPDQQGPGFATVVYDGKDAYTIEGTSIDKEPADKAAGYAKSLAIDYIALLPALVASGKGLVYVGETTIDGDQVHVVEVPYPADGTTVKILIDKTTKRFVGTFTLELGKLQLATSSEFETKSGILVPMVGYTYTSSYLTKVGVKKVELDAPLPKGAFDPATYTK